MILKIQEYDDRNRIVTRWMPNVLSATQYFNDEWNCEALQVSFGKDSADPGSYMLDNRNLGVYLCNDEGKTVEVIRRLRHPVRE